ncbi:flagellin, partial [Brevundimonas sp. GN22]
MANSINTNRGALVALQTLNQTNKALETTQNRVNTGMKVSSAKDNGAIFAIATSQRAEMGAQDAVKQSLQRGQSIVDVALAAGETVTDALTELKSLAVAIQDSTAGGSSETKLLADFDAIVKEIHTALAGATFDGVNLFKTGTLVEVTTNTASTGNKFTLKLAATAAAATGLAFGGSPTPATGAWDPPADATAKRTAYTAANVDTALNGFTTVLADLGTKSKSLDRQLSFVSKLQDSLETGIGNLVDADLAK